MANAKNSENSGRSFETFQIVYSKQCQCSQGYNILIVWYDVLVMTPFHPPRYFLHIHLNLFY